MSSIYISFNLKTVNTSIASKEELEKDYESIYRPLAKLLYSHANISFSFSFTGIQIQYYKKHRNELITIMRQLMERNQLEILGGGFYDPILPLLYSVDRTGQIDMLSNEIKQITGKRPRGITLFADCWDSSLVNSLDSAGIEYILLDSTIIQADKRRFLPIYMSDLGKAINIFPYYDSLCPNCDVEISTYVENIIKQVEKIEKAEKKDTYCQLQPNRIININLTHQQIEQLLKNKWFEKFSDYISTNPDCRIKTIIPSVYKKLNSIKIPAYIPAGINGEIAKWIGRAFTEIDHKQTTVTVHDFMNTYPQSKELYNRIMYVSMLVNQYKNDKMRKKFAREKLWQAQNGTGLLCSSKGAFSNSKYRQQCYKYLMEAEKILREDDEFTENVSCFDYNSDGIDEYVCRMENYFSYIALTGGAIQELDILKNTGNYADNLSRYEEYDGCSDLYERGLFVDHVLTEAQFQNYLQGKPAGDGVFSRIQYSEIKYQMKHHEVQLGAEAVFLPTKQKLYLKKKYIINSTGMIIQYILKNESEKPLDAYFVIESNFAHTNFEPENITYYDIDVVDGENIINLESDKSTEKLLSENKLKDVSIIRITDSESGISFGLEPNENCGLNYYPLIFKRPDFNGDEIVPVHMTFVTSMFWHVQIEPGKETERTINFTITAVKKTKKR